MPSMISLVVERLLTLFRQLGRQFTPDEVTHMRGIILPMLEQGWATSPHSFIVVRYETKPPAALTYQVDLATPGIGETYDGWVGTRPEPFFGQHPNAKVVHEARRLAKGSAVLDVGAGDGRNALPLARDGFKVHAVELSAAFGKKLAEKAWTEGLPLDVHVGDACDPELGLPTKFFQLVVIAGVIVAHIRRGQQLRKLFEIAARALAPGGRLLFSVFYARDGYVPDATARELQELLWTVIFTRGEIDQALRGLGLELVDEVPYEAYETDHGAPGTWPPTPYFGDWARGLDLFDLPADTLPLELVWVTLARA